MIRSLADRPRSSQYRALLQSVYEDGEWVATRQGPRAKTLMQQTMRFDLREGFPLITERSLAGFWRKPISELCAFINGATTVEALADFGCDWWADWATEEKTGAKGLSVGEIGPGSYGGAFRFFPTSEGPAFDQIAHVMEQISELPELRTHFISPWIPQYQGRGKGKVPKTTIAPCHGWVHIRVLNGGLHLHMFQRSGDVPIGVPSNMVQYAALMLMLEHLTGYEARTYYHTISDAHIYEPQMPFVEQMLAREPMPLPMVRLNESGLQVADIREFRGSHFDLEGYEPHPAILRIPVSV